MKDALDEEVEEVAKEKEEAAIEIEICYSFQWDDSCVSRPLWCYLWCTRCLFVADGN
jgi:hypothetical protein